MKISFLIAVLCVGLAAIEKSEARRPKDKRNKSERENEKPLYCEDKSTQETRKETIDLLRQAMSKVFENFAQPVTVNEPTTEEPSPTTEEPSPTTEEPSPTTEEEPSTEEPSPTTEEEQTTGVDGAGRMLADSDDYETTSKSQVLVRHKLKSRKNTKEGYQKEADIVIDNNVYGSIITYYQAQPQEYDDDDDYYYYESDESESVTGSGIVPVPVSVPVPGRR